MHDSGVMMQESSQLLSETKKKFRHLRRLYVLRCLISNEVITRHMGSTKLSL